MAMDRKIPNLDDLVEKGARALVHACPRYATFHGPGGAVFSTQELPHMAADQARAEVRAVLEAVLPEMMPRAG